MADIFLSYASADREQARRLADAMEKAGHSVWWDRQIAPGQVFDEVIEQALSAARCVVVLWSSTSVKSDWVKVEASEAASRKVLVPVLIDTVKIPLEFRRLQAADLTRWDGKADDPEFKKFLLAVVAELKENPSPPPTASQIRRMSASAGAAAAIAPRVEKPLVQSPAAGPAAVSPQPTSVPADRKPVQGSIPQSPRPRRAIWAFAALPVLLIAAFFLYNNRGVTTTSVVTPDVVGMPYESAIAALTTIGLAPDRQDHPSNADTPGTVVTQNPPAGTKLEQNAKVILTVVTAVATAVAVAEPSSPPVDQNKVVPPPAVSEITIPDLKGQTVESALQLLTTAGLSLGIKNEVANNEVVLGNVISQDPEPTKTSPKGSAVNITVATKRIAPQLIGLKVQKAQAELARLGLTDRIERIRASGNEADDAVVKQSPAPGQEIVAGGQTLITVAIVSPKKLPGGEGLHKTAGARCAQVCKDSGLKWTNQWSGTPPTCTCGL